jgi:hypothetical protein
MLFIPIDAAELRDVFVGHESGVLDPEYTLSGDYRENLQRLISIKFVNPYAFSWQRGLLQSLDEAGTPGHILAQKIAGSVPRQTIGILGFPEFDVFGVGFSKLENGFRWHAAFREWKLDHFKHIDSELAEKQAKIKPIVLDKPKDELQLMDYQENLPPEYPVPFTGMDWHDNYKRKINWEHSGLTYTLPTFRKPGHSGPLLKKGKTRLLSCILNCPVGRFFNKLSDW